MKTKQKKQGITTIEFCAREVSELRYLVNKAMSETKGKTRMDKLERAYLKRLQFKLNGSYRCPHCLSWVEK